MNARCLEFPDGSFDTAALLGNGFGLGGNMENCRRILSELSRVVKPKGVLIASSREPTRTDNPLHLAYHERNRKQGKPIGMAHLRVNFEGEKGEWFDLLMIEIKAIDDYISGTGWVREHVIESDDPLDSGYGVVLRNRG
jgi:ubiquinone/menaquinone biosynthesis C-methylase UbiE